MSLQRWWGRGGRVRDGRAALTEDEDSKEGAARQSQGQNRKQWALGRREPLKCQGDNGLAC